MLRYLNISLILWLLYKVKKVLPEWPPEGPTMGCICKKISLHLELSHLIHYYLYIIWNIDKLKHVKLWDFLIDLLIYTFYTNREHKIGVFSFDLQNWQNNIRLTTFIKYANKQRIGRLMLTKLNKSWICLIFFTL